MILGWTRPQAILLSAVALVAWWVICRFAFARAATRLRFSAGLGLVSLAAQILVLACLLLWLASYMPSGGMIG